jgi:hypothetical protein
MKIKQWCESCRGKGGLNNFTKYNNFVYCNDCNNKGYKEFYINDPVIMVDVFPKNTLKISVRQNIIEKLKNWYKKWL